MANLIYQIDRGCLYQNKIIQLDNKGNIFYFYYYTKSDLLEKQYNVLVLHFLGKFLIYVSRTFDEYSIFSLNIVGSF